MRARVAETLPPGSVCLPSGLVTGGLATINRMALVGASISNGLSPCRHIYAHHMLADGLVAQNPSMDCNAVTGMNCPCKDGSSFCALLRPPTAIMRARQRSSG